MKKAFLFIMALMLALIMPLRCMANETNNQSGIDVKAKSSVLMCIDTGEIIYENNAYEHLSPASVTKLMSILLVLEAVDSGKISLTDEVTATEEATKMGGSQIWLEVGESMTVDDLFKAVVVASANDACVALGVHIAGSLSGFVQMMNDRSKELGLENSNFENCTGLDDTTKNHYSCAYDLGVIACEIMKHSIITDYSTIWLDSLRNGETELNNTNKLINKYDGITGLKTGTTSNAGFCLCATASRDNLNLVAVVLGSDTSDDRFNSARNLLDFGFANYQLIEPQIDESQITSIKVKNGVAKEFKPVYSNSEKILVKKGEGEISYKYEISEEVNAPVFTDDKVGRIIIYAGENIIKEINLVPSENIDKISFSFIFKNILNNI